MRRRGGKGGSRAAGPPQEARPAAARPAAASGPAAGPAALAAAALGVGCCAAGLGGGLLYDDRALVIENQDLRPQAGWASLLVHDYWGTPLEDPRSHTSWRPVTVASLKLNYHAHELAPAGFHAVNLALHGCVCALVVLAARCCGVGGARSGWGPALCGLLFAAHPVHVEAVANVAGRAELLSALFALLTFVGFATAHPPPGADTAPARPALALGTALCFVLAVLAKETGFTVLVITTQYARVHTFLLGWAAFSHR